MADQKVSDLPSLNGADVDAADLLYIVDSSAGAAGSKKITIGQYQLAPVSGGTANTVVYLNGSKVESSSSALTFDGTNFATTGTSSAAKLIPTGGTATGNGMYLPAANTLAWSNNGAETMRLDSSGNLGLGVTPSAWGVNTSALQMGDYAALNSDTANGAANVSMNAFFNGTNWIYRNSSWPASYYSQINGQHRWLTAPSGTAGNAITFTQAMTLDASGQLLLGGTSLDNPQSWGRIAQVINSGSNGAAISVKDSNNEYNIATYNGALLFSDGTSERARITSGGELCIGVDVTTTGARLRVQGSGTTSATYNTYFGDSSGARLFAVEDGGRIYTGTSTNSPYNNTTASAANMFVDSAGILFRSTSSLKYKTDVQDATHGLAEVMQLRSVTYKGKNDGDIVFGGLIAEEVHAAGLTEFVQYAEDGSPDALAYGNMVSLLTKAIQEQQAIIEELRARVAALEAK